MELVKNDEEKNKFIKISKASIFTKMDKKYGAKITKSSKHTYNRKNVKI